MRRAVRSILIAAAVALLARGTWAAAPPSGPLTKCPVDAVVAGTVCMDRFEASVWRVPSAKTSNAGLVAKIQQGTVKVADLVAGGAIPLGTAIGDHYAPCAINGQNCANDIYAVSLAGVLPSRNITWLQAQAACKNARKRLPSNAEWQAAVIGTPDPGPDNGTTDCNTFSTLAPVVTGSRSSCVSADGAFDMVGNLDELVADWVPRSTSCSDWSAGASPTDDGLCFGGAATEGEPGVLRRGGDFLGNTLTGPLEVFGINSPSDAGKFVGFRCAR